jgi:transglutaminase-like putative cysteine protease
MPLRTKEFGLGVNHSGRYAVVAEPEVLSAISLCGWLSALQRGALEEARGGAARSLERWISQGLRYSMRGGHRRFDVSEVLNHCVLRGRLGGDVTWDRFLAQSRGLACEFREPEGSTPPEADSAGRYAPTRWSLSLRREFNLDDRPPGSAVRLRIPIPYEDPAQEEICVDAVVPSDDRVQIRRAREYLEARLPTAGSPWSRFTLGVDLTARVYQIRRVVDPALVQPYARESDEYILYTRPIDGLIKLTPEVRRAAAEAAGRLMNPWLIAEAIWVYLCENMFLNSVHLAELEREDPLGWALRHGWCDCYLGAALFVGLCRACCLPARVVGGICLYSSISFLHYWAEILIPPFGWVPMDATSWSLAADGGGAGYWGQFFCGRLDYRLRTECFPKIMTGPVGKNFQREWYLVQTFECGDTVISYYDLETGALLYRDRLRAQRLPEPSATSV